jgi:hypothetical protein
MDVNCSLISNERRAEMDSLMAQLSEVKGLEEELHGLIFRLAFLLFMIYEFAVFFRFLWRKWCEDKTKPSIK